MIRNINVPVLVICKLHLSGVCPLLYANILSYHIYISLTLYKLFDIVILLCLLFLLDSHHSLDIVNRAICLSAVCLFIYLSTHFHINLLVLFFGPFLSFPPLSIHQCIHLSLCSRFWWLASSTMPCSGRQGLWMRDGVLCSATWQRREQIDFLTD